MWVQASFHNLRIQTYTEPAPLKYEKLATKYPWIYEYFVQHTQRLPITVTHDNTTYTFSMPISAVISCWYFQQAQTSVQLTRPRRNLPPPTYNENV